MTTPLKPISSKLWKVIVVTADGEEVSVVSTLSLPETYLLKDIKFKINQSLAYSGLRSATMHKKKLAGKPSPIQIQEVPAEDDPVWSTISPNVKHLLVPYASFQTQQEFAIAVGAEVNTVRCSLYNARHNKNKAGVATIRGFKIIRGDDVKGVE